MKVDFKASNRKLLIVHSYKLCHVTACVFVTSQGVFSISLTYLAEVAFETVLAETHEKSLFDVDALAVVITRVVSTTVRLGGSCSCRCRRRRGRGRFVFDHWKGAKERKE